MEAFKEEISMREAFGNALVKHGFANNKLVVLDADVSNSTRTVLFGEQFPERFFNVGVAESNMVSVAAGLACSGLQPVVSTFAIFLSLRATEQIRNVVCYNNLPVILVGGYAGLSDSFDGASHQSVEDIAVMRAIPNLQVLVPPSASFVEHILREAFVLKKPVYLRLCRNPLPVLEIEGISNPFQTDSWQISTGNDITVAVTGSPSHLAQRAVSNLKKQGISSDLFIVSRLKPFFPGTINESLLKTKRLLTIEEHSVIGGLTSTILESCTKEASFLSDSISIQDVFGQTGSYNELLTAHGLTVAQIEQKVKNLLRNE